MSQTIILLLWFCLLNSVSVRAINPIRLRATSFFRDIILGTAVDIMNLQRNVDQSQYVDELKNNYRLIVSSYELRPQTLWLGENIYNFADPDFLLGATPNSTGWTQ
jgi:hypothetical protein